MCRLFFSILLFSSLYVSARTITGVVYSDSTALPVSDAQCVLFENDSIVGQTATDTKGRFFLKTVAESNVILEIDKSGYTGAVIMVNEGVQDVDLYDIKLSTASLLSEIEVEGSRIFESKGHTILFPSATDVKASSSMLSLLQKLPLLGLETDVVNRKLSVDGKPPVILVNGIPSTMADINSMNPENIAKIEYSYVTPARYVDQGYQGLLSITLKKRQVGGQIYAWTQSAVNATFVDANIQASYHQGASLFTLLYTPSWRNDFEVYDKMYGKYIGEDMEMTVESSDKSPFNYHVHAVRLDYVFAPTDRTMFSARLTAIPTFGKSRMIGTSKNSVYGDYDIRNFNSTRELSPSLDLFVHHDFNSNNSIEAQVVATLSSSDYRRDNIYIFADGHQDSYVNNIDNRRRSLISELCYSHNFVHNMQFSAGIQNTLSHNTNEYIASGYKPLLTENNNYIYATLAKQFNRVFMSVSTGAKFFWTHNDKVRRHFLRNLSAVNLGWNINQRWSIMADFAYTPYIPILSSLTDYMVQTEPYLYTNGNPELKVQDNLSYKFAVTYQYKKFTASIKAGYFDFKNSIVGSVSYLGDGKFLLQNINSDRDNFWSGDLQLRLSDVYGFGANISARLRRYYCKIGDWNHSLTSFTAGLNVWWTKGPWTISYYRKFPGKSLDGYMVSKAENTDKLSVDYRLGRHWNFGIGWWYMFDKKGGRYPYWNYSPVAPSYVDRYSKESSNMVIINVSYTADFGSLFKHNTHRSLNNSDSNSSLLKN